MRLSSIFGSLGDCVFLCGDSDGVRRNVEDAENGRRGERSRRRDVSTFLREPLGLAAFSAGSTLGAARPQTCAKESSTLWTLLALRRGRVSAYTRRRHPGTRRDPPESNLCSGGSICMNHINSLNRPDSKRPQALKSRVARAKRCGSDPVCRGLRGAFPPDARAGLRGRSARGRCPWGSPRR